MSNDLSDVAGLRVGHHDRRDGGYLTGTTVVLPPPEGAVGGVDVRGGAPGTRETDLLDPTATVRRVHAIVLTGGSAYGLAAATGVADRLEDKGIGFPVGPGLVVPIVPAAVLFDLGRGGDPKCRPDAGFGAAATEAASTGHDPRLGSVGAGTGAVCGGLKGGVGMASAVVAGGATVAALTVVNAAGSAVDSRTGELWGERMLRPEDLDHRPGRVGIERWGELQALRRHQVRNTTLAVVATDATLTKAQCATFAGCAQDGLARAINPIHTGVDGDTAFGLSTAARSAPTEEEWFGLLTAAADVVTRAVVRGLVAARTVTTAAGTWPGFVDLAIPPA